jgi:uncharacterized protein (DUF2147 family)
MQILNYIVLFLWTSNIAMTEEINGFWQTIDEETKQPTSVIAIYSYEGNCYGRIIGIYDKEGRMSDSIYHPKKKATAMIGEPFYCGLDIVIEARPKKDGTWRGQVLDPRNGNMYRAELRKKGNALVLRGKYLVFGKNISWLPFPDSSFTLSFLKPDLSTFVPVKTTPKN